MLHYVTRCITVCYTMLHYVTLCITVCYTMIHYVTLCYTVYYNALQCVTLSVCYGMCTQCVTLCYTVLVCVTQCNTTLLQVSNVLKWGNYLNQSFMKLLNFRCFTSLDVQCTAMRPIVLSSIFSSSLPSLSPFCSSLSSLPVHSSLLFLFSPYTYSFLSLISFLPLSPPFPLTFPLSLSRFGSCCQGSARLQWTFFNPFAPWPVSWGQL